MGVFKSEVNYMRIICWLKTIWRTMGRPTFWQDFIWIDGCDFVEQKDGSLKCEVCGKVSK